MSLTLTATLQEHKANREAWAVGLALIHSATGELPFGIAPGLEVSVVGDRLGLAAPGERLELTGKFEPSKWGQQFRITQQRSLGIKEPHEAALWLQRLDGVGPKLARALVRTFGERLPAILAGEEEADLTQVHGIGDEVAAHIRDSYQEIALSGDLESIQYLDGIRASRYESTKILQWCAKQRRRPIEVLEGAPYDLMAIKGLGFKRVDRLAKNAGCAPDAPARLEAATMHTLGDIVQRGSTMASMRGGRLGGLVGETSKLLGLNKELVRQAVGRLAASGRVVMVQQEGRTWIHPAELLKAERAIYKAAKGITKAKVRPKKAQAEAKADPVMPWEVTQAPTAVTLEVKQEPKRMGREAAMDAMADALGGKWEAE